MTQVAAKNAHEMLTKTSVALSVPGRFNRCKTRVVTKIIVASSDRMIPVNHRTWMEPMKTMRAVIEAHV